MPQAPARDVRLSPGVPPCARLGPAGHHIVHVQPGATTASQPMGTTLRRHSTSLSQEPTSNRGFTVLYSTQRLRGDIPMSPILMSAASSSVTLPAAQRT